MGWNCMECGELLKPKANWNVRSKAGNLAVDYCICSNCDAEFITVFRHMGDENNYLGLVKIWPDTEGGDQVTMSEETTLPERVKIVEYLQGVVLDHERRLIALGSNPS